MVWVTSWSHGLRASDVGVEWVERVTESYQWLAQGNSEERTCDALTGKWADDVI